MNFDADSAVGWATLDEVRRTTSRLAFTENELGQVVEFIKMNRKKGLATHIVQEIGTQTHFDDGLICLCAPELMSDYLFVKCNAGRGFFGGQKSNFKSFIGSAVNDLWTPSGINSMFGLSITGINNIYRSRGLL